MSVKPELLLLGFGQLNSMVAEQLASEFSITAVSRTPQTIRSGKHVCLDLQRADLSVLADTDYIVYCLTPANYDPVSYRQIYVECLSAVLRHYCHRPPKRLFFVSSTSVYGQKNDEIIDENSVTEPSGFNGKILLEAEQSLGQSIIPSTVVRFSGIYGHDRAGLLNLIEQGKRSSSPPSGYTNRIAEDDAVGILCHLLRLAESGQALSDCYLASDDLPVRLHELVAWIRQQIPCKPEVGQNPRQRAGSKRCHNQRIKASGYVFRYPTFKEGYAEIIASR